MPFMRHVIELKCSCTKSLTQNFKALGSIFKIKMLDAAVTKYNVHADVPYRWKFLRHEKFAKSLKTGFSRLFVRETTRHSQITCEYQNCIVSRA